MLLFRNRDELSYVGEPLFIPYNADALFTCSIKSGNFNGICIIEGTLSENPEEHDWVEIYNKKYTSEKIDIYNVDERVSKTNIMNEIINFKGNFLYLRARIDRDYLNAEKYDSFRHGSVNEILINT